MWMCCAPYPHCQSPNQINVLNHLHGRWLWYGLKMPPSSSTAWGRLRLLYITTISISVSSARPCASWATSLMIFSGIWPKNVSFSLGSGYWKFEMGIGLWFDGSVIQGNCKTSKGYKRDFENIFFPYTIVALRSFGWVIQRSLLFLTASKVC